MINSLGICVGASTVSITHIQTNGIKSEDNSGRSGPDIIYRSIHPHEGNPQKTLISLLSTLDIDAFDSVAVTGRKFRNFLNLTSISEPEAVEYAYRFAGPPGVSCPAIVSAGGETIMVYALNNSGRISNVITGNKCASGTGEFFMQQLRRLNVSLREAAEWAGTVEPYEVSGRCSVFCKSDCTHATNKGIPKSNVISGLCRMMAKKILELLSTIERRDIMIIGGTAQNRTMIEYLGKEIPGLFVPEEAPFFEALGAALWALDHKTQRIPAFEDLFRKGNASFSTLPPLRDYQAMVDFRTMAMGEIIPGDECILGLDVGSTTTKAVLVRTDDNAVLASVYLRTNGDPVCAARKCYTSILNQITNAANPDEVIISALGICGSGRQIAGLHADTEGVINEIIAHAAAAVHFDPQVDTIFEIGGQDAKYTYITNGVPSDYAMNEACSAGTGSFLEESALEILGIQMEDIADIALEARKAPNFNDQCAAFIASDIKNAIHEGIQPEDIVAGLVYSVCMNYSNRVKGNRPVGGRIFMQGGVCYNRAVPLAMAILTGKPIIVPPEPGLMGAFGVALEVKKRIQNGLMKKKFFDIESLAGREAKVDKPFVCSGGGENCGRKCKISTIEIDGQKHPFGGTCNRYYNLRYHKNNDLKKYDLVMTRQNLVFGKYASGTRNGTGAVSRGKIGINKSFMVNIYYPLYSEFFTRLGLEPVLPGRVSPEGINKKTASFCFPGEQSNGFFHSLLQMEPPPEYIFLPHFKALPALKGYTSSQVCPIVQGEPFYLQAAFHERIEELKNNGTIILSPIIDLSRGIEAAMEPLILVAMETGAKRKEARDAFLAAMQNQLDCISEMKTAGKKALDELNGDPDKIATVLFSRPYNGFCDEGNMGIPSKFASRGITVIPMDFLLYNDEKIKRHMYWGMGQHILNAARIVKRHPRLFGIYITNFSCGPDSFINGYFRDIMGKKPSLTLELDSHTADTGLETRIEAFLDIITSYKQLNILKRIYPQKPDFVPARAMAENGIVKVVTSSGEKLPATDPRVTILIPPFGKIAGDAAEAVVRGAGYNVVVHEEPDDEILKLGRANTSCKECLPLILTTGILLNYIYNKKQKDEILIYVMPTASGPCRFGQYNIFMDDLISRLRLQDVALFTLTSENSYVGLSISFEKRAWWASVISDCMEDIRSMILANAGDPDTATGIFNEQWSLICGKLEGWNYNSLKKQLLKSAAVLRGLPMKRPVAEVPVITLTGEIFIRRDSISRQYLTERLAEKGFAVICSPNSEWMYYSDYLVDNGMVDYSMSAAERLWYMMRKSFMGRCEKKIKALLSRSGLFLAGTIDIGEIIKNASPYISPALAGEAILTIGCSLTEVASKTCGVIAIGPFGCMPNRLSESILSTIMNRDEKLKIESGESSLKSILIDSSDLPFLAVESDGSPLPQIIEAKLDAFCLRAERLHSRMLKYRVKSDSKLNN